MDVYIRNNSGQIIIVCGVSAKHDLVGMVAGADKGISFAVGQAWDLLNF